MLALAAPARRRVCARCRLLERLNVLRSARLPRNSSIIPSKGREQRTRSFATSILRSQQAVQPREETKDGNRDGFADYFAEEHRVPGVQHGEELPRGYKPYKGLDEGTEFRSILVNQLNRMSLDVKTLGSPSRILNLPQRKPFQRKEPVILEESDMNDTVDVLKLLQTDDVPLEEEITFENIDMIRDRWLSQLDPRNPPSQADCIKIYKTLSKSFPVKQLEAYFRATAREEADDIDDFQGVLTTDICSRSKWYPGRSNMDKTYAERLFGEVPPVDDWRILEPDTDIALRRQSQSTMTKKPTICEAILRKSWKIRSAEECERSGELDVAVKAEHMSFLESTYQLTRQIENQLKISFEYRQDRNVFRIRGTHWECRQAFWTLYRSLRVIRVERMELDKDISSPAATTDSSDLLGTARLCDQNLLDEIGAATRSKIIPVKNGENSTTAFDVMFLAPRADGGYENTTFESVRLIIDRIKSDQSNETFIQPLVHRPTSCHRVPVQGTSALPMFYRNGSWSRFRADDFNTPHAQNDPNPNADLALGLRTGLTVLESWRNLSLRSQQERNKLMQISEFEPQSWNSTSASSISMRTGKLAFEGAADQNSSVLELKPSTSEAASAGGEAGTEDLTVDYLRSRKRVFVPSTPGGISSFDSLNEVNPVSEQRIVLTLKPIAVLLDTDETADAGRDVTKLPSLRVELSAQTDKDGAAKVLDARLVSSLPSLEVMVPEEEFDLQLTPRPHIGFVRDNVEENLARFVNQLVIRDGRLDTRSIPSKLEVIIPTLAKRLNSLQEYGPRSFAFLADRELDKERDRLMSRSKLPWNLHRPAPTAADLIPSDLGNITGAGDVHRSSLVDEEGEGYDAEARDLEYYVDDDEIDKVHLGHQPWENYLRSITSGFSMSARYKYTSVEYHSRIQGRFRGFPMTYSIVDAGEIGGRYEELSLEARESGEKFGIFDTPAPDRIAYQPSTDIIDDDQGVETATFPGDDNETPTDDPKATLQSSEADARHRPIGGVQRDYEEQLRENPALEWFLPFWNAALDMVRKSR